MGAGRASVRLSVLLLIVGFVLGGPSSLRPKPESPTPCSVSGLAQVALLAPPPLPAWTFPEPDARPGVISLAPFTTLYDGTQARVNLDTRRAELMQPITQLLAEQPVQMVRKGAWRALWPQVIPCLAGRPVVRLGYSQAKRLEMPDVALLSFRQKQGEVQVPTSALWVAPSRSKGEPTWIIATAMGPMDQRSLIYRQPNAGYTLDGPVTVMALNSTAAARTFAQDLGNQLAAYRPSEAQATAQTEAAGLYAAANPTEPGTWPQVADAYEKLLVLTEREAREPGPPRTMPFFAKEYQVVELSPPEVLLQMAQADMKAGRTVYGAKEALLNASYLAEEQGKRELLTQIRIALRDYRAMDQNEIDTLYRLAELEPTYVEHWWKLAGLRIIARGWEPEPIVAVAEAVGGADPARAAAIYLQQTEQAVQVSTLDFRPEKEKEETTRAARLLGEALRRQPDQPYGLFLKGVRESRLGNYPAARQALASLSGSAAYHERAIAAPQSAPKPVLTLNLSAAPDAMARSVIADAYMQMGYWHYSAKMPQPPAQQAVWAPSGDWLATTCTRLTGEGTAHATDLCLVGVPDGALQRVAVTPYQMVWTDAGLLYSLQEGGLWFVAPGGTPRQLAATAAEIAVAPDGYRVAFTSGDGLWVLDLRQGAPRRLTRGKHVRPLWSPDGRELFYAADVTGAEKWMAQYVLYHLPADGSAPPEEVGRANNISRLWFNVTALQWWQPGGSLLVQNGVYGKEQTLVPLDLDARSPLIVTDRLPVPLRDQATTLRELPDRLHNVVWVQNGAKLIPVPMGNETAPDPLDLESWPGFINPAFGVVALAPQGNALAYTYTFGDGAYLFVAKEPGDRSPTYLGQAELSVLGALGAEGVAKEAIPLDYWRQRALPGMPLSWSPDGRYLAWLKGDRLTLYAMQ